MTKKGSTDGVKNLGDQKDDKDDDGKGAKNVTFHRASVKGNEVKRLSVWLEELEFASSKWIVIINLRSNRCQIDNHLS